MAFLQPTLVQYLGFVIFIFLTLKLPFSASSISRPRTQAFLALLSLGLVLTYDVSRPIRDWPTYPMALGMLLLPVLCGSLFRDGGAFLGMQRPPRLVSIYALAMSAAFLVIHLTQFFPYWASAETQPLMIKAVLSTIFLTAIPEEFFFRGLLQNRLEAVLGRWSGLALASLIFAFSHSLSFWVYYWGMPAVQKEQWARLVVLIPTGFIYGYIFQKGRSVWATAAIHASYNLAVFQG